MKKIIHKFGKEVIIITGGIATGKSFVIDYFKSEGFHIFNSDSFISSLMEPNGLAYKKVIDLSPECLKEGYIDKRILSKVAFSNQEILKELEKILYPFLREYRDNYIKEIKARSDISIAIEIPLYFEKNVEIDKDIILSTLCPVGMQRSRAISRKKMDLETIDKIIAAQVSNEHREKYSDILIHTDISHTETIRQINDCLDQKNTY